MDGATQQAHADTFHRLHARDGILVLVNAWDAASARVFEAAGAPAIATTSAGMAWSLGHADGEQLSVRELLAATERICRVVSVPVTVDIERGFSRTAADVSTTVRALLDLGVVGINIEDGVDPATDSLVPPEALGEKIAAIRALAERAGVRLFINARTDTYFVPTRDPVAGFEDTVRRANVFVEAGADGIFTPGLDNIEEIARMARAVSRPLNIYAGYAGLPGIEALRRAGVRRVSLGCGPLQAALALARQIATEAFGEGQYTAMTASMLSARDVNTLFAGT